jgi:D-amino-acid dehydrogenase
LVHNAPVRRLLLSPDGTAVTGVEDAAGVQHTAGIVVVCAGASSCALAQTAGVFLPVYPLRGCSLTVSLRDSAAKAVASPPHVVVGSYGLYITQFGDRVRFTC